MVTVPVAAPPPVTDAGETLTETSVGTVMERVAVPLFPLTVAVIVAVTATLTAAVVTVNVADVCPAATVTVPGTIADELLDASAINKPPVGAGPLSVTVPVDDVPPATVVGFNTTDATSGDVTVSDALAVVEKAAAVIVDVASVPTGFVVTVNVAVVCPAAIVTVAGTVAAPLFEDVRLTTVPPAGAAASRVTVPVLDVPPTTDPGFSVTELMPG